MSLAPPIEHYPADAPTIPIDIAQIVEQGAPSIETLTPLESAEPIDNNNSLLPGQVEAMARPEHAEVPLQPQARHAREPQSIGKRFGAFLRNINTKLVESSTRFNRRGHVGTTAVSNEVSLKTAAVDEPIIEQAHAVNEPVKEVAPVPVTEVTVAGTVEAPVELPAPVVEAAPVTPANMFDIEALEAAIAAARAANLQQAPEPPKEIAKQAEDPVEADVIGHGRFDLSALDTANAAARQAAIPLPKADSVEIVPTIRVSKMTTADQLAKLQELAAHKELAKKHFPVYEPDLHTKTNQAS